MPPPPASNKPFIVIVSSRGRGPWSDCSPCGSGDSSTRRFGRPPGSTPRPSGAASPTSASGPRPCTSRTARPSTGCFTSTCSPDAPPPAALFARTDVGLTPPSPTTADPTRKMTRMYRWTRHVYDATRRFYLLGRNRTLRQIARLPAGAVLEVGCGTARNLRVLDRTAPRHTLFGVDASHSMLSTARATLAEGAQDRVEGLSSVVLPVARRYAYLATVRVAAPVPDLCPAASTTPQVRAALPRHEVGPRAPPASPGPVVLRSSLSALPPRACAPSLPHDLDLQRSSRPPVLKGRGPAPLPRPGRSPAGRVRGGHEATINPSRHGKRDVAPTVHPVIVGTKSVHRSRGWMRGRGCPDRCRDLFLLHTRTEHAELARDTSLVSARTSRHNEL